MMVMGVRLVGGKRKIEFLGMVTSRAVGLSGELFKLPELAWDGIGHGQRLAVWNSHETRKLVIYPSLSQIRI